MTDLLTEAEHQAIDQTARLWEQLCKITATGPSRQADLAELVVHIHAIQHAVMAQAAARAYSERYRLLGGGAPGPNAPGGMWTGT